MSSGSVQHPATALRQLRLAAGLSLRGLSAAAGVHRDSLRRAEQGLGVPHPATQRKIAAALSEALDEPVGQFDLWPLTDQAA